MTREDMIDMAVRRAMPTYAVCGLKQIAAAGLAGDGMLTGFVGCNVDAIRAEFRRLSEAA